MRVYAIIAAALAFIAAPALAVSNFDACADKAPQVVAAAAQFCTILGEGNVVPNARAQAGNKIKYKGKTAKVSIAADCNPPQWIPKHYCLQQFYQMCARGNKHGARAANWGKNLCQHWYIESPAVKYG